MKFGPRPTLETAGAILAHSIRLDPGTIKKGTRLSSADIDRIKAAGIDEIVVATLDPDDILEDDTATRLAGAISGPGIDAAPAATGRVNLYAAHAGLLAFNSAALIALFVFGPYLRDLGALFGQRDIMMAAILGGVLLVAAHRQTMGIAAMLFGFGFLSLFRKS